MDELLNSDKNSKKLMIIIIIVLIIILSSLSFFFLKKYQNKKENTSSLVASKDFDEIAEEEDSKESEKSSKEDDEPAKIKVDIKGEVNSPGVYEIAKETIVNELINMAGGLTANATTKNINLSRKLSDEMVVIIYSQKELENLKQDEISEDCLNSDVDITPCYEKKKSIVVPSGEASSSSSASAKKDNTSLVSLNSASKEELMTLSGIGEAKAEKIIAYREANGGFKNVEEIMEVSGIGDAIFAKIKDRLTL